MILVKEKTNTSVGWNRKPKKRPHKYSQMAFDKAEKTM